MSTHASADIETNADTDAAEEFDNHEDDVRALVEDLRDEVASLRERVDELEAENEELGERVEELESQPRITIDREDEDTDEFGLSEVWIEGGAGFRFPLGRILDKRRTNLQKLKNRVSEIEQGNADIVVRGNADEDTLPIEDKIAKRKAGKNIQYENDFRATLVFPKFGTRAKVTGGSKMVLRTRDVEHILEEKTGKEDWDTRTVHRVMEAVAKLTSPHADRTERDATDEENLITFEKTRSGKRQIAADQDEFKQFYTDRKKRQE